MNEQHTDSTPQRVLIIDDDLALTTMLKEVLKDDGLSVLVEHDGVRGLKTALAEKPDLILLDVMMPQQSGLDVVRSLRADEWGKEADVILLTNVNEPESLKMDEHAVGCEYLVKADLDLSQIAARVRLHLDGTAK